MAVVVIGGHTRNIGKTSVMCSLISAMPDRSWTAIKITQFGHGVCSANGKPCGCETADHTFAISTERSRTSGTDTARYLAAGASRSLWVRTRQGQLAEAMPRIRSELAASENVMIESNSLLRFLKPDFFASVLEPHVADFKASALRYLDRADAVLISGGKDDGAGWNEVAPSLLRGIPRFTLALADYASVEFTTFLAQRLCEVEARRSEALDLV